MEGGCSVHPYLDPPLLSQCHSQVPSFSDGRWQHGVPECSSLMAFSLRISSTLFVIQSVKKVYVVNASSSGLSFFLVPDEGLWSCGLFVQCVSYCVAIINTCEHVYSPEDRRETGRRDIGLYHVCQFSSYRSVHLLHPPMHGE